MGKVVKTVIGVAMTVVGVVTGNFALVAQGVSMTFSALTEKSPSKSSTNSATQQRLSKTLVPEAARKIVLGKTAVPTDLRYWEVFGAKYNNYVEVMAAATHRMTSYGSLYIDEAVVPFSGSNATGKYAGALKRYTKLEGATGAGMPLGSGSYWGVNASMHGCSYWVLDWAWTQATLPNGIPSRYTQEGEGSPVYDPRRDVAYGGTHVITDQTTWEYSPLDSNGQPIGRNNALQQLRILLGWTITSPQTGVKIRVDGRGVDPADINLESFIESANNCELQGWYSDCVLSTGDSHSTNEGILEAAAGGKLVDTGGRWSYWVAIDDTASIACDLDEDDLVDDAFEWVPKRPMSEQFNEVAGTYIDPGALYQPRPYPMVKDDAYYVADGFKKRKTVAFSAVQSSTQAQKLARITLNAGRRQGVFRATFNWRSLVAENYNCVRLTFAPLGFTNKLFRIIEMGLVEGGVDLTLQEEDGAVYLGGTIVSYVAPSAGVGYDPFSQVPVTSFNALAWGVTADDGVGARDALLLSWADPGAHARSTETRYRVGTSGPWTQGPTCDPRQLEVVIEPLLSLTDYQVQARHISDHGVEGAWVQDTEQTNAVTTNSAGEIVYSDGTPIDSLRPAEGGANVTGTHNAGGLIGSGSGAYANNLSQLNAGEGTKFATISPNAGTTLSLVGVTGSINIIGNSIQNAAAADGYYQVRGEAIVGPCYVEMDITASKWNLIGLNITTGTAGTGQTACFQFHASAGSWSLYTGGVTFASGTTTAAASGKIVLIYDGLYFRAFINGVQFGGNAPAAANLTLYPKFFAYNDGATYTGLNAGTYADRNWQNVGGTGRPSDNAGKALFLVAGGVSAPTLTGNSATVSKGAAGFTSIVSTPAPIKGGIVAMADISNATWTMVALDDDNTSVNGQTSSLFYLQYNAAGNWYTYLNGSALGAGSVAPPSSGVIYVTYDGVYYRSYINGTEVGAAQAAPADLSLYPKWYLYDASVTYTGMLAAPFHDNAWSTVGGTGRPSDNAGTSGVLTPIGSYSTVVGNSISKATPGTHGAEQGGAVGVAQMGSAYISSSLVNVMGGGGWTTSLCLDDDAASYTGAAMSYHAMFVASGAGSGYVNFYINGTGITTTATVATNAASRMTLAYDGAKVIILIDGAVVYTYAAPAGLRLWPKVLEYYQSASVGGIVDIQYGAWTENTVSTLTLIAMDAYTRIDGNGFTKIGHTGNWTGTVYSQERFVGGCVLSWVSPPLSLTTMVGLCDDASPTNTYSTIDYAIFMAGTSWLVYENGSNPASGTFTYGDAFTIHYDGTKVRYYKTTAAGVTSLIYTSATSATGRSFFMQALHYYTDLYVKGIKFTAAAQAPRNGQLWNSAGTAQLGDADVITSGGNAGGLVGGGNLLYVTLPSHASQAAAVAAGMTVSQQFLNTTTGKPETVQPAVAGGVAKAFSSGVGGTTCSSSAYTSTGNVLLELNASLDGGKVNADATSYWTFTLKETNSGGTTSYGPYPFSVDSSGLEFPSGQWAANGGGVTESATGVRTGSVTYSVDLAHVSGPTYAAGAVINCSLKITPIS